MDERSRAVRRVLERQVVTDGRTDAQPDQRGAT